MTDLDVSNVQSITIHCQDGDRTIYVSVPTIRQKDLADLVASALAGSPETARGISTYESVATQLVEGNVFTMNVVHGLGPTPPEKTRLN